MRTTFSNIKFACFSPCEARVISTTSTTAGCVPTPLVYWLRGVAAGQLSPQRSTEAEDCQKSDIVPQPRPLPPPPRRNPGHCFPLPEAWHNCVSGSAGELVRHSGRASSSTMKEHRVTLRSSGHFSGLPRGRVRNRTNKDSPVPPLGAAWALGVYLARS